MIAVGHSILVMIYQLLDRHISYSSDYESNYSSSVKRRSMVGSNRFSLSLFADLHLAVVLDVFSHLVVGWDMNAR
jgi:hypothetical protein